MERQEAVDRIILACDGFEDKEELLWALRVLKGRIGSAKLGAEMLLDCGRELIDVVRDETGMEVMADPKLADIPETNAKAVAKLLKSKPKLITIKIDTGSESIRRCVELCGAAGAELVGIAVLTSIKEECKVIYGDEVGPKIEQLSELFVRAGGGVLVSSPSTPTYAVCSTRASACPRTGTTTRSAWARLRVRSKRGRSASSWVARSSRGG